MAKLLDKCFSPCMMIHISCTAPVLGVCEYGLISGGLKLDSMFLFAGWASATYLVCNGGQRLTDVSRNVGTFVNDVDWYQLEAELQRDLTLVLRRCMKPSQLKAGAFGGMSYSTIQAIVKTSYSYMTFMNQTI
ncbi:unnamed protein product [Callosobruchus maculatus]|nr:unnamed protein product [Callosobruchus maculatus]